MRDRIKRLHRVTAYDADGFVVSRRDFQSAQAAEARAESLLEGRHEEGGPFDDGYHREPAARVTIQTSEPVTFLTDPVDYERKGSRYA